MYPKITLSPSELRSELQPLAVKERSGSLSAHSITTSPRKGDTTHDSRANSLRRLSQNQQRVRDRLIALLNATGQRVGIPKSPSVIFSANSQFGDFAGTMHRRLERTESIFSSHTELANVTGTFFCSARGGKNLFS